jgi:hypothetical protein
MEKQQTAIDWLCEKYHLKQDAEIVQQAKEMEKEQIINAVNFGDERGKIQTYYTAEKYYNETFKKN